MAKINQNVSTAMGAPDTLRGEPVVPPQWIRRMRVLYFDTSINLYMLAPEDGPDVDKGTHLGAWNNAMSPFGMGAQGGSTLVPGTRVFALMATAIGYVNVAGGGYSVVQILSVNNEMPATDTWFYNKWKLNPYDEDESARKTNEQVRSCQEVDPTDRLRGAPSDMAPGDWVMGNPLKGNLFVGGTRVGMEASPVASLHMYGDDSTVVFNKGLLYIEDTPLSRKASEADKNGASFEMEHSADTLKHALGHDDGDNRVVTPTADVQSVPKGTPVKLDVEKPLWDNLSYRGRSVGGSIKQRTLFNKGGQVQPGVFDFEGVDGTVIKGSANSLTLTRTPDLPFLEMTREFGTGSSDVKAENEALPRPETVYATQYADLMYELMKRKFVEKYWSLQKKSDDWKTLSMEEVADQMGRAMGLGELKPLDDDDPAYRDSNSVVTDPVTGKPIPLSKLESYVHLSPTGALVISDGTGSEIRLEGGHIILSPAVDFRIQPGRDMVATIPRFLSLFSRDRAELTSDRGEIDIHAAGNAVLSAEGVVTVESRGTKKTKSAAYDQRGLGGGVIIRSATDTEVIGSNVRVALQASDDRSRDGVGEVGNGMIIIDGGASPVAVSGRVATIHARDAASLSAGGIGTGVVMDGTSMGILSTRLTLPIEKTVFGGSGVMKWIDTTYKTMSTIGVDQPNSSDVTVQGDLRARDDLSGGYVVGDKGLFRRLKSLNAKPKESLYIKPEARSGPRKKLDDAKKASETFPRFTTDLADSSVSSWFRSNGSSPLMTADGVRRLGIYYPKASGYHQANGFWTPSRWQRMMKNGPKWSPVPVKDADDKDMLPYPGMDGWNGKFLSTMKEDGSVVSEKLSGNWTVNSK